MYTMLPILHSKHLEREAVGYAVLVLHIENGDAGPACAVGCSLLNNSI